MIRNIWAVGRNYGEHAKELGHVRLLKMAQASASLNFQTMFITSVKSHFGSEKASILIKSRSLLISRRAISKTNSKRQAIRGLLRSLLKPPAQSESSQTSQKGLIFQASLLRFM